MTSFVGPPQDWQNLILGLGPCIEAAYHYKSIRKCRPNDNIQKDFNSQLNKVMLQIQLIWLRQFIDYGCVKIGIISAHIWGSKSVSCNESAKIKQTFWKVTMFIHQWKYTITNRTKDLSFQEYCNLFYRILINIQIILPLLSFKLRIEHTSINSNYSVAINTVICNLQLQCCKSRIKNF